MRNQRPIAVVDGLTFRAKGQPVTAQMPRIVERFLAQVGQDGIIYDVAQSSNFSQIFFHVCLRPIIRCTVPVHCMHMRIERVHRYDDGILDQGGSKGT